MAERGMRGIGDVSLEEATELGEEGTWRGLPWRWRGFGRNDGSIDAEADEGCSMVGGSIGGFALD